MNKLFMLRNGYAFRGHLGEGMFGTVVRAFSAVRRSLVAIKIIDNKKVTCDYRQKFLPHERRIVRSLIHPNIVRTYDILQSPTGTLYMVMELCSKGDLLNHISHHGELAEQTSRSLFKQLCLAVKYLHDKNVAHRDLKCENLLLDEHFNLKVSDFGLSKTLTYVEGKMVLSKTYCGTCTHAPPEVLSGIPYNPKLSDVWSMGVVLHTMLFGSIPFEALNVEAIVKLQTQHRINFPSTPSASPEAKELIRGLLHPDVKKRLTVDGILQSAWLLKGEQMEDGGGASTSNANSRQPETPEMEDPGAGPLTAGTKL